MSLSDNSISKCPHGKPFPTGLDAFLCSRYEIADYCKQAWESGVQIIGVCCGNAPHFMR